MRKDRFFPAVCAVVKCGGMENTMIMVDIDVPSIGRQYNFRVDETVPVEDLVEDVKELIRAKENADVDPAHDMFDLVSYDRKIVLQKDATLSSYDFRNGSRFMLV